MSYRADIDGLRAIAVVLVIFFHAGSSTISGGYIGVDVFFVISGYLIVGLIMADLREGSFRFGSFWVRRARRIVPALLVIMLVTTVLFTIVFPPILLRNVGHQLLAQSFFSSNVLFFLKSGYFDTESHAKPLLHTWSLSLEAQFYLIIPVLLWLLTKIRQSAALVALVLVFLISLVACIWLTPQHPALSFYLLPTRAWELATGGILALLLVGKGHKATDVETDSEAHVSIYTWIREITAFAGLALIVFAAVQFDNDTAFPGSAAILPVAGTAMLIWANGSVGVTTRLGQLLSARPIVWAGLVSYSLYLWHWILLTFNRAIHLEAPSQTSILIAVAASIVLAVASYYVIEQPIRRRKILKSTRNFVIACVSVAVLLVGVGGVLTVTGGLPQRLPPDVLRTYETALLTNPRGRQCYNLYRRASRMLTCRSENGQPDVNPSVLVWGDSHADALYPAFEVAAQVTDIPFTFSALGGCPTVTNMYVVGSPQRELCKEYNDEMVRFILDEGIKSVILINRFNVYVNGWDEFESTRRDELLTSHESRNVQTPEQAIEEFKQEFSAMVGLMLENGVSVFVVPQLPNFNVHVPDLYLKAVLLDQPLQHTRSRQELNERGGELARFFAQLDANTVDLSVQFCDELVCRAFEDGVPMFRDDDHVSIAGGERLTDELAGLLMSANAQ